MFFDFQWLDPDIFRTAMESCERAVQTRHQPYLKLISAIDCACSLFFPVLTCVVFLLCWKKVKSFRSTMLFHLFVAIAVFYVFIILADYLGKPKGHSLPIVQDKKMSVSAADNFPRAYAGAKHNKCSITPLFPAVFVILEAMSWCYLVGKKFWHQKRNGFTLWDEVLQLQSWRSLWQQLEPSLMQRKTVGLQQNVVSFTGHLLLQLRWLY